MSNELTDEEILELQGAAGEHDAPRTAKNFWPSAKRLLGLLAPHKVGFGVVIVLVVLSVLLNVYAPRVTGRAVDVIFNGAVSGQLPAGASKDEVIAGLRAGGQDQFADMLSGMDLVPGAGIDFGLLGQLILVVLALYVGASVLMWLQGFLLNRLVMRVIYQLRADVEAKLNRLPLSYFDRGQRGDILSRTTNDVDNVQQALQQSLSQALQSVLMVLGIMVMMFTVSWRLTLVALLAIPLTAIVIGVIGSRSQAHFKNQWRATGQLNGHVEETFSGHEVLTIFGRHDEAQALFDDRNRELFGAASMAQFLSGLMMPIMQFISYLSYVAIAVFGGLMVAGGSLSLGAATAFIQYSRQFNQPLGELGGMAQMVQSGVASAERVFEFLDAEEEEPSQAQAGTAQRASGHVEFRDVSFSYTDEPLIQNLNVEVQPGQKVAIVGPTGAGKTTLVNLIMRFYEIDSGQILLDGVDTRQMSREALRSQIGMVLQDAVLFEGTIMDNIRYGRLDATDEEVIAAAKATYVDRFVHALPDGYDTIIDQDGGALSAGERQLITIARAFVVKPSLLILDEATSSVDTRTEVLVQRAMGALQADRTSFVIAHRLSTIRDADLILVMQAGRIVEQGTHDELLTARGAYWDLNQAGFASDE
ncbi:ABC transporter ATP-binding protein [Corynebacterium pilosum]|uniref:Fatty acid ABC transporter ATP-binding/permease protein n=1 Tax=Corynebacterium pilosum TaxID=35756 RepID=A0A376CKV4_9CORY|nr:ABC transporter ATP-binding protein [Corynebacterium pilosum]STC68963.1 ABC transport system, ATP-binding protein [Corynebacterium pilosum]